VSAEDIKYIEDVLAKQNSVAHDESISGAFSGNSADDTTDASDWSSTRQHKQGERVKSGSAVSDGGTYTLLRLAGDSESETIGTNFNSGYGAGTRSQAASGNTFGTYFENGTYSLTNGVSASSAAYFSATFSNRQENDKEIASAANDPATSWTSIFNASQSTSDWRIGSKNVSAGVVTSGAEGFLTLQGTSATRTFDESADQWAPSMSGSVWNDWSSVAWYLTLMTIDQVATPHGSLVNWPGPPNNVDPSSTAQVSETTTASSTVTGVTTTSNGAGTTNSNFSTTNTFNDSAYLSSQSRSMNSRNCGPRSSAAARGCAAFCRQNSCSLAATRWPPNETLHAASAVRSDRDRRSRSFAGW